MNQINDFLLFSPLACYWSPCYSAFLSLLFPECCILVLQKGDSNWGFQNGSKWSCVKTRLLFFVLVNRLTKMLAGEKKTKFALVMVIQDSCTVFWEKKNTLDVPWGGKEMGPDRNPHKYRCLLTAKPTCGNSCQTEVRGDGLVQGT